MIVGVTAALLHLLWECAHVRLYTGYEHLTHMPILVYAISGDVLYTLVAIFFVSLVKGQLDWLAMPSVRDLMALMLLGFWIALFVEYKALALHQWAYLDTMPIIPILNVGLSPIVQMTILLPLTVLFSAGLDRVVRRLV